MYTLEYDANEDRPYKIRRPDGTVLYTCRGHDKGFAQQIVTNLNAAVSLSPEDSDELLAASA